MPRKVEGRAGRIRQTAEIVFGLVSNIATMNDMDPMSVLTLVHYSGVYETIRTEGLWDVSPWTLYEKFCEEKRISCNLPLKEWSYPGQKRIEFICEVFETYLALTSNPIPGYVLDTLFIENGIYKGLSETYESAKELNLVDLVLDIESVFERNDVHDERVRLVPIL